MHLKANLTFGFKFIRKPFFIFYLEIIAIQRDIEIFFVISESILRIYLAYFRIKLVKLIIEV